MVMGSNNALTCLVLAAALTLVSCKREERRLREPPPIAGRINTISMSSLHPGGGATAAITQNPFEENAWAVSEGKRLFDWYNCSGCHSHGGGGMGPALMDDEWIYGSDPANIFATIVQGRPNGMPSFRGKIPDQQVWELAAFVRSMAGLLGKDVSPARDDDMSAKQQEQSKSADVPDSASTGAAK
jgi:cytochrome c oxidase cbb3-type subunit 3